LVARFLSLSLSLSFYPVCLDSDALFLLLPPLSSPFSSVLLVLRLCTQSQSPIRVRFALLSYISGFKPILPLTLPFLIDHLFLFLPTVASLLVQRSIRFAIHCICPTLPVFFAFSNKSPPSMTTSLSTFANPARKSSNSLSLSLSLSASLVCLPALASMSRHSRTSPHHVQIN
jgi:hypothetical protein